MDRIPFALTIYIWPISEAITICKELDYRLCNPNPEDVAILAEVIKAAYFSDRISYTGEEKIFHEDAIKKYFEEYSEQLQDLHFKGSLEDFWSFLAANWVILKTDNWLEPEDEFDSDRTFNFMNSYISIVDFYRGMFTHLITNTLLNRSFFPIYNTSHRMKRIYFSLNSLVFGIGHHLDIRSEDDGSADIYVPQLALLSLVESSQIINGSILMSGDFTNMHFFGDLIYSCFVEAKNYYLKAVSMCALIEYMVARSPDSNKFNVDESINKQFQMKPTLLASKFDDSVDLNEMAKFLKFAYALRSSIAHGSFDNVNKLLAKSGDNMGEFDHKLHEITLLCFRAFLNHPEYADFIKRS